MAAPLLLVALVALFLLAVGAVVLVVVVLATARPDGSLTSEVRAARRHSLVGSVLAGVVLAATLVVMLVTASSVDLPGPDRVIAVVPLVGAGAGLLVLLIGELTWPRPRGATRTALLHDRSARSLLRGPWSRAAAAAVTLLVVVLTIGCLLAYDGHAFRHAPVDPVDPVDMSTHSPFPGWYYAGPQLVALLVVLGLAALVVRAALRRSAVVTADLETDLLLRRASAARALRMVTAAVLVTAGADVFLGGNAIATVLQNGTWALVANIVLFAGPLLALTALTCLVLPVPRLTGRSTSTAPAVPADA